MLLTEERKTNKMAIRDKSFWTGEYKYDNYTKEDFINDIKAAENEIYNLGTKLNEKEMACISLNSQLWKQKCISFGLTIVILVIILGFIIKVSLSKIKHNIRKELMEEIKESQNSWNKY